MNILVCTKVTQMDAIRHVSWVPNILIMLLRLGLSPGPCWGANSVPQIS